MESALTPFSGPWGLLFVLGNVLLSQIGLPIPAEPTLVLAGASVFSHPSIALPLIVGASCMCVLADVVWFLAGRHYGSRILQLLCSLSLTPDICASDTLVRFDSWGANALVIAKFIPGISLLAPPVAGALKMPWRTFLTRTSVASLLWVCLFLGSGYLFNRQIRQLIPLLAQFKPLIIPTLVALAVLYVAYKWWGRRRLRAAMSASRVSVADTMTMLAAPSVPVIVDVRSQTARALDPWQIPQALHIVPAEIATRIHDLPLDRDVILYCTCPNDASAAQMAGWLIKSGRPRARTLHGGLPAWREAGHPLESILPVASGLSGSTTAA